MGVPKRLTIRRLMATVGAAAVLFSVPRCLWWCVEMIDRREQCRENSWSFDGRSPESAKDGTRRGDLAVG